MQLFIAFRINNTGLRINNKRVGLNVLTYFLGLRNDIQISNFCFCRGTAKQASIIYADEADMLNVAMFGMTAKMWRKQHPELKGNIRDYASINELICLSNMENLNAVFIDQGIPQGERLIKLNQIAIQQMKVLEGDNNDRKLLK